MPSSCGAACLFSSIQAGYHEYRREFDRAGGHSPDPGDRSGSLRRRRLRYGRDHGYRAAASAAGRRRCRPGSLRDLQRTLSRTIGHLGCYSFHETKNFISGEGGALVVNDERFLERAEVIREKGTNRSRFFRGMVDKYTWVDIGSSYIPSELIAAFLYAQLEQGRPDHRKRLAIWNRYYKELLPLQQAGVIRLPVGAARNAGTTRICSIFS